MIAAGAVSLRGGYFGSMRKENHNFCKLSVTNRTATQICGKLTFDSELVDNWSWIRCPYYGLAVELQGTLEVNLEGCNYTKIKLLLPHDDSPTVYTSKVYNLISGDENGMKINRPDFKPQHKMGLNKMKFSFQLTLPNEALPPTLFSRTTVTTQYFIVALLRTEKGYKELGKSPFIFPGHLQIQEVEELVQINSQFSIRGITTNLTSPKTYYLPSEILQFSLNVKQKEKEDKVEVGSVQVEIKRIISFIGDDEEEKLVECKIIDSKIFKVEQLGNEFNLNGTLKLQQRQKSLLGGVSKATPPLPSYNDNGLKIQYFLQFEVLNNDQVLVEGSEEIFVGTCNTSLERGETSANLGSKFGSLLSLFPPSYSTLSSRRGSLTSLVTLPPHYYDLDIGQAQSQPEMDA